MAGIYSVIFACLWRLLSTLTLLPMLIWADDAVELDAINVSFARQQETVDEPVYGYRATRSASAARKSGQCF